MQDITTIFGAPRINRLNALVFTGVDLSIMLSYLGMGQLTPTLLIILSSMLVVAWAVLLLPVSQLAKCLIIPVLPSLATFVLVLLGEGRSFFSLSILGSVVMSALYFRPTIILVQIVVINGLFLGFVFAGYSLIGLEMDRGENFNHLIRMDLLAIILFIGTKWSSHSARTALEMSRRSDEADRNLKELNATLEAKVEERTRELEELVADLREAQEQLIISEKQASLGGLVAGVSHEVNTPLGVCITAITKMKSENEAFVKDLLGNTLTKTGLANFVNLQGESLDIVTFNLFRAAEIIRSFKEIAVNQSSEVMVEFCLDDYIRTILTSLKHELKNRQADIAINFEQFTVNSYPGAFSHIITNLIMNTLVHGYDPHERVEIAFDARREHDHLIFQYTDHGKGIPPEIIQKIFDPFFTTRRGSGGSGLGLNIVYNMVRDKLHGTISCDSILGEYTTFTIRI